MFIAFNVTMHYFCVLLAHKHNKQVCIEAFMTFVYTMLSNDLQVSP